MSHETERRSLTGQALVLSHRTRHQTPLLVLAGGRPNLFPGGNIDTRSTSCARGGARSGDQTAALGRRRPCRIAIATNLSSRLTQESRRATSVDPRGVEEKLSNNASPETAQSLVASRWPEPTGVFSSAAERPISPSFDVASTAPDTRLDASVSTDLTSKVPPVAPTRVKTSATGAPASLQMLLLATFGVIAVSWGGAIYLMARMRRPQRYTRLNRPEWPTEEPTYHTGLPPWLEPTRVNSTRLLDPGRDAGGQSLDRQSNRLGDNASEVKQLLARFANQAQAGP